MLLFVYYMICWGFKNSVIRKYPITEFLLAKRKRYVSTLNLTLMTVIIYTGNKVKSNRGREENQPTGYFFFSPAINISHSVFNLGGATSNIDIGITLDEMLCKIFRKPHSTAGKFAPKTTFFIKVFSFVFLYRKNALSLQKFSEE